MWGTGGLGWRSRTRWGIRRSRCLRCTGDQSPQAAKAQAFAEELRAEFGITVHLWDERLTTTQAHRHLDDAGHAAMGRKGIIDQVAAVLILQSFLEARANQRSGS
jgi:putative Holliday junction resolvase